MGSHSISFWRENNPGMSDYQLAEKLSAIEPREGAIIVRYKSCIGGEYDQFGSCADEEMLLSYFRSSACHDTEILYVHPLVPLNKVRSGLRITDDAPTDSCVFKLKQLEEEKRRIARIQSDRHSSGQCTMCGQPLNFLKKLFGANRHTTCTSFKE